MATASTNLPKSKAGYGYKYTELAQINEYLESIGVKYYQYIETTEDGTDYMWTVPIVDGKELNPRRGCKVIQAAPGGKANDAQAQGSGITYARRYSLLMAFGLATEDDDAASLSKGGAPKAPAVDTKAIANKKAELLKLVNDKQIPVDGMLKLYGAKSIDEMSMNQISNAVDHIEQIAEKLKGETKA